MCMQDERDENSDLDGDSFDELEEVVGQDFDELEEKRQVLAERIKPLPTDFDTMNEGSHNLQLSV